MYIYIYILHMQVVPLLICQVPPLVPFVQFAIILPFDGPKELSYPEAHVTLILVPNGAGVGEE